MVSEIEAYLSDGDFSGAVGQAGDREEEVLKQIALLDESEEE